MKPAAIAGSFADFRPVKSRSVAQLIIEVPIEHADAALAALGGVPQPGHERPVAIARIVQNATLGTWDFPRRQADATTNATAAQPPDSGAGSPQPAAAVAPAERGDWATMNPTRQAGIRCNDPRFQKWIGAANASDAAEIVRQRCGVASRAQLDRTPIAAAKWREIDSVFRVCLETEGREDFLR